jgi:hypothetical protein
MGPIRLVGEQTSQKLDPAQVVEVLPANEPTATVLVGRTAERLVGATCLGAPGDSNLPERQNGPVTGVESLHQVLDAQAHSATARLVHHHPANVGAGRHLAQVDHGAVTG